MARHLNLLASAAQAPSAAPSGLPGTAALGIVAVVALSAGGASMWAHQTGQRLASQLAAQSAPTVPTGATPTLDATVIAALEIQVRRQEALARALTGDARGHEPTAPASRWLDALAEVARPGVSITTLRLEPGPRLALTGAGATPGDVNGFIARLQAHPLAGTAALGQLEVRSGESATEPFAFRLTPPPPEGWGTAPTSAAGGDRVSKATP